LPRPYANPDALCSTEWLEEHLYDPRLRILDGSFHLPGSGRDARAEYAAGHIPGALFFDIDDVRDPASTLPHMLPPPEVFAAKMQALGIGDDVSSSTTSRAPARRRGSGGRSAYLGITTSPCSTGASQSGRPRACR